MSDDSNLSLEDFLLLEAKERCYEIEIKGLKDFEREKARILENGKQNVRDEYEKKLRQIETQKRIEKSSRVNGSRLRKMQARNGVITKVLDEAEVALARRAQDDKKFYRGLLKNLILQCFIRLFERSVVLRCLERDRDLVKKLIPECITEFQAFIKKELEIDWPLEVDLDERTFLSYRKVENLGPQETKELHKSEDAKLCFGGILGFNEDLSIVVKNTLDARLELCYQDSLPNLRGALFPALAPTK